MFLGSGRNLHGHKSTIAVSATIRLLVLRWVRASCSCIWRSPLAFGISIGLIGLQSSCFTWMDQSQEEMTAEEMSQDGPNAEEKLLFDPPMPHPKISNAWNTKVLVMTNALPPDDRLKTCREQIAALTQDAGSSDDLMSAQMKALPEIQQDPLLYHWCFYHTMTLLDDKLLNDNMEMPVEVRNKLFNDQMSLLWVMSRALDQAQSQNIYFPYLRTRYLQLSHDFFGRDIDTLGPPFGNFNDVYAKPEKKKAAPKPAFEADVDL